MRRTILCTLTAFALAGCSAQENAADEAGEAVDAASNGGDDEWCELTARYEALGDCARLERQYESLDAGVDAFKPKQAMIADRPETVSYAITRLAEEVQGDNGTIASPVPTPSPSPTPTPDPDSTTDSGDGPATRPSPAGDAPPEGPTQDQIDAALADAGYRAGRTIVPDNRARELEFGRLKVGRLMYACLEGDPSFTIEPQACQTLDTFEKSEAVWRWTVTPTAPGKGYQLLLQSGIELRAADGSARRIGQPSRTAEIEVSVTAYGRWQRFLADAEQWIRSPIGVLLALAALAGAVGTLIGAVRRARRGEGAPPGGEGEG